MGCGLSLYDLRLEESRVHDLSIIGALISDPDLINKRVWDPYFQVSCSALHMAVRLGHEDATLLIIQTGGDVNAVSCTGHTALHWAALYDHPHIIDVLLQAGASLEQRDELGETPLYLALAVQASEAAVKLIQAGADVSELTFKLEDDEPQVNALTYAAVHGLETVVHALQHLHTARVNGPLGVYV